MQKKQRGKGKTGIDDYQYLKRKKESWALKQREPDKQSGEGTQGSEDTRNKTILTFTTVRKAVLPKTKEEEEKKKRVRTLASKRKKKKAETHVFGL